MCISDYMQSTFMTLSCIIWKSPEEISRRSMLLITKRHIKHTSIQPFTMGGDSPEIARLLEVSVNVLLYLHILRFTLNESTGYSFYHLLVTTTTSTTTMSRLCFFTLSSTLSIIEFSFKNCHICRTTILP